MKIIWTVVALAGSVTGVNAQQTPRRVPPPQPPVVPATPTPAPAPRAVRPDPAGAPGFDWLIDAPNVMLPGVPGQGLAPWAIELTPMPAVPGQFMLPPLAIELTPMPAVPGQFMLPPLAIDLPGLAPLDIDIRPMPGVPSMGIDFAPMIAPAPMVDLPATPLAPLSPMIPPMPAEPLLWDFPQGQGPTTPRPRSVEAQDRALQRELEQQLRQLEMQDRAAQRALEQQIRQTEMQDRQAQRQLEQQLAQTLRNAEQADRQAQRQVEQQLAQAQRQLEQQERQLQRELEQSIRSGQHTMDATRYYSSNRLTAPAPWAPQDVADSAYRAARELFNRGEYGQAAAAFRTLPTRYPNSVYAPEAAYYQAFSLFRIGGTNDLREALAALEASKTKYPNAKSRTEATNLTSRIQGVLAQRGDQQAAAALARTANEQGVTCDREEQAIQAEAMNALSRSDAGNVNELITRVLARKDECSVPLRRTAVFLVGNRRDAQAVNILAGVARNDPSVDVQVEAIQIIGRLPNEEGVPVLEDLAKSSDERVQRAAVRALVRHPSAKAKASVRSLIESDAASERVKSEALSAFDSERATAEDVAWLRALYAKSTSPTLKARTLSAIVRIGGPEVDQWLATIARDETQPSEIRSTAMRRIGATMSIADLAKLYDGATTQRFRSEIINVLGKRKEDAAADKLIDIIKNGTDPSLRRSAIQAITEKNDPRATQLLLEIINK